MATDTTTMMTAMNLKQRADTVMKDVRAAVEAALPEGATLGRMSGRYGNAILGPYVDLRLSITIEMANADGQTAAEADWHERARRYGVLNADWFGKRFKSRSTEFEVTGYNYRAPEFPVTAKRVRDGRTFKFTVEGIRSAFGATRRVAREAEPHVCHEYTVPYKSDGARCDLCEDERDWICGECGEWREDDARVAGGMKCGVCAYGWQGGE